MRRPHLDLTTGVLAVVLAAGCSAGGDGGQAVAGDRPAANAPSSGETDPAGTDAAERAEPASPLEEFMGWNVSHPEEDEAERERQGQVEQLVVECMRAEGFEYIAVDPEVSNDFGALEEITALPPDEFAERYGYGITTIDVRALADQQRDADPNTAIEEALSDEAGYAYQVAMWGARQAAEKYGRPIPANADELPGCRPTAEEQVYGDRTKQPPPVEFEALREEMEALWDRIFAEPRVTAAAAAWGDCMADAGYSELRHPDDARAEITRRIWQLHGEEPPPDLLEVDRGLRRQGKFVPGIPMPRNGQEPDLAALAQLQEYEIAVAVADLDCRPDYDQAVAQARRDIEEAFIEANRAELERYREALSLDADGR